MWSTRLVTSNQKKKEFLKNNSVSEFHACAFYNHQMILQSSDDTFIPGGDRQVGQSICSGFGWQQEAFPIKIFICHEPDAEGSVLHYIPAVSNRF